MDELKRKIIMWRTELERQEASQGVMMVFDSICVYLGEQHRKIVPLDIVRFEKELMAAVAKSAGIPADMLLGKSSGIPHQVNEKELIEATTRYKAGEYVVRLDGDTHSTGNRTAKIETIHEPGSTEHNFQDFRIVDGRNLTFDEVRHATDAEIIAELPYRLGEWVIWSNQCDTLIMQIDSIQIYANGNLMCINGLYGYVAIERHATPEEVLIELERGKY